MTDEPIKFPTVPKRLKVGAVKALNPRVALVLVEKCDVDAKTEGGIVFPENLQRDFQYARVISVGPGTKNFDTGDLKTGDIVMYQAVKQMGPQKMDNGLSLTVGGIDCLILNSADILAIVTDFETVATEGSV